jgi:hypothetical protein
MFELNGNWPWQEPFFPKVAAVKAAIAENEKQKPIYCTDLGRRTRPGDPDPVTRAFEENPESDGIVGVRTPDTRGGLPDIPTPLVRTLNAGNEIELRQYPKLGDRIFSQARYADIKERVGKDGSRMLIVTTETIYTNQKDEVLCILRASSIKR